MCLGDRQGVQPPHDDRAVHVPAHLERRDPSLLQRRIQQLIEENLEDVRQAIQARSNAPISGAQRDSVVAHTGSQCRRNPWQLPRAAEGGPMELRSSWGCAPTASACRGSHWGGSRRDPVAAGSLLPSRTRKGWWSYRRLLATPLWYHQTTHKPCWMHSGRNSLRLGPAWRALSAAVPAPRHSPGLRENRCPAPAPTPSLPGRSGQSGSC